MKISQIGQKSLQIAKNRKKSLAAAQLFKISTANIQTELRNTMIESYIEGTIQQSTQLNPTTETMH